jgi:catechol 2,3-dioxygenase-like lactoylglutathione lyase family enzyme
MVVRDAEATCALYTELLGGVAGSWQVRQEAPKSIDPSLEPSEVKVIYGRYGGMTIEVLSGRGHYARWLEENGEGVQHLGFWVQDIAASIRHALETGAVIRSASFDEQRLRSATVSGLPADEVTAALRSPHAMLGLGSPAVEIEFVGTAGMKSLRGHLGDAVELIVDPPPF